MLGDGTAAQPRRAGLWQRLDLLMALIDDGLICAKPDGTIDPDRVNVLEFSDSFVADFGVVGVRTLGLERSFWEQMFAYEKGVTGGDTVAGRDRDELLERATAKMTWIKARIAANVPANRQLNPNAVTVYDDVRRLLGLSAPTEVRPIRNYYANQLNPATVKLSDVPAFLKKAGDTRDTVDPVAFRQARDLILASTESSPGRYYHNMYELAYLDVMVRNL